MSNHKPSLGPYFEDTSISPRSCEYGLNAVRLSPILANIEL